MMTSFSRAFGDPLVGVLAALSLFITGYLLWATIKERWEDWRQKRDRERRRKAFLKQGAS